MAYVVRVVSPEQLGLPLMVTCLTMTVIGGRLSAAGGEILDGIPIPGCDRFEFRDPFGNRVEMIETVNDGARY